MKLSVFYNHIEDAARSSGQSVPQILRALADAGVSHVDVDARHYRRNVAQISAWLSDCGLAVSSLYALFDFTHDTRPVEALSLLRFAARAGVGQFLIVPGFVSARDTEEVCVANAKETLRTLVRAADVQLSMENFDAAFAPYHTPAQLEAFARDVPGLGITFDTDNYAFADEDVPSALERLRHDIVYVHCKDRSCVSLRGEQGKKTLGGHDCYPCAVGEGYVPVGQTVRTLRESGYDGFFAIEHFDVANPLGCMLSSAAYLTGLI